MKANGCNNSDESTALPAKIPSFPAREIPVRQLTIRVRVENNANRSVFSGFRPALRFGSGALRPGESLVSSEVMEIVSPPDTEVLVPGMKGILRIRFLSAFGPDQHPRICPGAPVALQAGSQILATGTILDDTSTGPHAESAESPAGRAPSRPAGGSGA